MKNTMNIQERIMIAVTGLSLLAVSQARAQLGYSPGDLLLNFRDTADFTGNDLEVDAGPITAIEAFQGTEVLVSSTLVQGVYGAPSASVPIGFSASADDGSAPSDDTLFLSRADTTPGTAPTTQSSQASALTQSLVLTSINQIGIGGNDGTPNGPGAAIVTGATTGNSYQAQGEQNNSESGQAIIDFGSHENVGSSKGGNIESIQDGSGTVYEALWEVPVGSATTASDTYLGFFTFDTDGEVDFTSASVVIAQTPVSLSIIPNGPNSVQVLWTNSGNFTLQQNDDLAATNGWTASGYSVSTSNGTNSITVAPATGNLFFRLVNP
jgi:hypothetical protein